MDKKTLGYVVGAVAIAAAVAATAFWDDWFYVDCNGQKCDVAVEANDACTDKKAKPHKIRVKTKGADVYWTAPTGYQFCATDAPKFKDPQDEIDYGSQFTNRCKTTTQTATCLNPQPECAQYYHWTSVGEKVKKLEYEITITKTAGNTTCKIDPWIRNG